jgi:hypothetical protein
MKQRIPTLGALSIVVVLLAGCGVSFYPRMGSGTDRSPIPTDDTLRPGPPSPLGGDTEIRPAIEQICRARPTPSGWVIIAYAAGGDACPASREPDDAYNVAVIERHSERPVGSTMIVCADQAIPRDWVRDRRPHDEAACPGARVGDNEPTVSMIRRIR